MYVQCNIFFIREKVTKIPTLVRELGKRSQTGEEIHVHAEGREREKTKRRE
jgi:hypothetical protein